MRQEYVRYESLKAASYHRCSNLAFVIVQNVNERESLYFSHNSDLFFALQKQRKHSNKTQKNTKKLGKQTFFKKAATI